MVVKNLQEIQVSQVRCLGWEDYLEKEIKPHSSILAGKSHGQRRQTGYSWKGCKELDVTKRPSLHTQSHEHTQAQPRLPKAKRARSKP